jgi:hypothetical protein
MMGLYVVGPFYLIRGGDGRKDDKHWTLMLMLMLTG